MELTQLCLTCEDPAPLSRTGTNTQPLPSAVIKELVPVCPVGPGKPL